MRNLRMLDAYRVKMPGAPLGDGGCGAFRVPSKIDGHPLVIVASSNFGWDHVSVSRAHRCPNWPEMEQVRRMFYKDEESAFQYHAPIADYVDGSFMGHPYCLHMWRSQKHEVPVPPKWMVGGMTPEESAQRIAEAEAEEEADRKAKVPRPL